MTTSYWEFGRKLARNERRLIVFLREHPGATNAEISRALRAEGGRAVRHLVRIGHVVRTDAGRRGDPYRHAYVGKPS